MANLLIVEDDRNTNEAICEYMQAVGHRTFCAHDGQEGIDKIQENKIDLVILDIMLPKMNGIDTLREIRKDSTIPILMLTAVDDEYTQITSFDAEADDYITKPFSMILLGKRVNALLKRCSKSTELSQLKIDDLLIDFIGYRAMKNGKKIEMTPKEIELLKFLAEHKGMVLSRAQILDELWGFDSVVIDRTIDTYVKNIRKKLGLNNIITVKGVGYKYEEQL